jgi:hypothetical protein
VALRWEERRVTPPPRFGLAAPECSIVEVMICRSQAVLSHRRHNY